jgi:hypothetical protein
MGKKNRQRVWTEQKKPAVNPEVHPRGFPVLPKTYFPVPPGFGAVGDVGAAPGAPAGASDGGG